MDNVSNPTVDNQTGVQASGTPQDTNNYEAMYKAAQSGNDTYINLKSKYGDNFEEKLDGFSEFEKQWTSDPKGTIENLQKQAGITVNEQPQPQSSQEDENVWEILQQGSKANQRLKNEVSSQVKTGVSEGIAKYKQEQQVTSWRRQLNNKGITDYRAQDVKIREFLNPNPDFGQFLQGLEQPNQAPRPSEVIQQVTHSNSQPQPTSVLQGGGLPPQKTSEEADVERVMKIGEGNRDTTF